MKTLKEIIKPHKDRLNKTDYKNISNDFSPSIHLFQKWAYRIERGHYGFALEGVPYVWALIIDGFLKELEAEFPDFKIQQIKLKFGALRFYVDLVDFSDSKKCTIINNRIDELEKLLFNESLIY